MTDAERRTALEEIAALGIRRVSVGGALARCAWAGFMSAASALANGRFDGLAGAASGSDLNRFFSQPPEPRTSA